ncbi:MAG: outer membrane protein assembly factor BamE [Alphaproteobacteria bacterium]|nr:outer membrane protein assembly factor BamE [Alphaproteobacteria bacterium]MDE2336403.1 outer membrane protein assembly factor BamE [Alphaproteobacteria bacterium]
MKKRFFTLVLALAPVAPALFALGGCTPVMATRGNLLTDDQLQKVKAGATRADVVAAWGQPTVVAPFDQDTWYYIGERTAQEGIYAPVVLKRRIVCVTFSRADNNTVTQVSEVGPQQARDVTPVSQTTPTAGKDYTLFQQFVGNIGRYNGNVPPNQ